MAQSDDIKNLEMRLRKLETILTETVQRAAPTSISAEEMQAYQKVRDVIAADWGGCINECGRCIIFRCLPPPHVPIPQPCIYECSCGPCNIGRYGGGLSRFSALGD